MSHNIQALRPSKIYKVDDKLDDRDSVTMSAERAQGMTALRTDLASMVGIDGDALAKSLNVQESRAYKIAKVNEELNPRDTEDRMVVAQSKLLVDLRLMTDTGIAKA